MLSSVFFFVLFSERKDKISCFAFLNPLNACVALIQKPVALIQNQLTGFYMRATLAFNGLKSQCFVSCVFTETLSDIVLFCQLAKM